MTERREFKVLAPNATGRVFGYAAWVLLALLSALILWFSLRACSLAGVFPGLSAGFCSADADFVVSESDLQRGRLIELQREVEGLEQSLALSPACQSTVLGELNCPPSDPDEIAIVLDASLSMNQCARLSPAQADQVRAHYDEAYTAAQAGDTARAAQLRVAAQEIERSTNCSAPNRRFDSAMDAIRTFAGQSISANRVTVASLGSCNAPATEIGVYGPNDTGRLVQELDRLDLQDRTPLAATITAMTNRIEGGESADDPVSVMLVSDGQDSCGADPCAAAQAFHAARPYAVINVITVGGDPYVGLCIAEATGGNVYDARDAANLPRALRQASGQERPDGCR